MCFLLQVFKKQRGENQTPDQWADAVHQRLHPPTVTLHNYGGDPLNIIQQVSAKISCGGHTCTATVLVQEDTC